MHPNIAVAGRVPTPLVIEAELALYIADAFGGDKTSQLVRGRMMQANLTGCRFGWMGRRDRLYCHEALPIIEQILDEKTELLWSQAQTMATIGEAKVASALQLVAGVAALFANASSNTKEQGARLNEDGLRDFTGWAGGAPSLAELEDAWQAMKAGNLDGTSWVGLGDVLRTAVSVGSIFGQSESPSITCIGNHGSTATSSPTQCLITRCPKFSLLFAASVADRPVGDALRRVGASVLEAQDAAENG